MDLQPDALSNMQIARGTLAITFAKEIHRVVPMVIKVHVKQLHTTRDAMEVMWYRLTGMFLGDSHVVT